VKWSPVGRPNRTASRRQSEQVSPRNQTRIASRRLRTFSRAASRKPGVQTCEPVIQQRPQQVIHLGRLSPGRCTGWIRHRALVPNRAAEPMRLRALTHDSLPVSRGDITGRASQLSRLCACTNRRDGMYYACSHNRKGDHTASILIAFDADPNDVVIDGRDFLYAAAQLGNPTASREALGRVFGPAVLRYPDRCLGDLGAARGSRAATWRPRTRMLLERTLQTISSSAGVISPAFHRRSW